MRVNIFCFVFVVFYYFLLIIVTTSLYFLSFFLRFRSLLSFSLGFLSCSSFFLLGLLSSTANRSPSLSPALAHTHGCQSFPKTCGLEPLYVMLLPCSSKRCINLKTEDRMAQPTSSPLQAQDPPGTKLLTPFAQQARVDV